MENGVTAKTREKRALIIRGPFLKCAGNYRWGKFVFWLEKLAGRLRKGP